MKNILPATQEAHNRFGNGDRKQPRRILSVFFLACLLTGAPVRVFSGSVVAWGNNSYGQLDIPPGLTNVVHVAAGYYHSVAVRYDGTVVAWGLNNYGQADVPVGLQNVVRVSAGRYHCTAMNADGSVVSWGITGHSIFDGDWGQSVAPTSITNAVAIAAGQDHNIALLADGSVTGWGSDDYSQISGPRSAINVVNIAAGTVTSFLVLKNGTVLSYGRLDKGRIPPAGLSDVVSISSYGWNQIALKRDGTIVTWGWYVPNPPVQPNISNVIGVAASEFWARVLLADGRTATFPWGGDVLTYDTPSGIANPQGVAVGAGHSILWTGDAPFERFAQPGAVVLHSGAFAITIPSRRGLAYRMESTEDLKEHSWTFFTPVPGTGQLLNLEDTNANVPRRFYRVRQE